MRYGSDDEPRERMGKSFPNPDIGKDALIYKGHSKGWHGRLLEINLHTAKIECSGRHPPFLEVPKKNIIVL